MMTDKLPQNDWLTLLDVLDFRVEATPDRTAFIELDERGKEKGELSYKMLQCLARRFASVLHTDPASQLQPGDRVLLLLDGRLSFIASFFACLYAHLVPVPCAVPQSSRPIAKLLTIAADSGARAIIVEPEQSARLAEDFRVEPILASLCIHLFNPYVLNQCVDLDTTLEFTNPVQPADIAFLQYTSGSTSNPKGVVLQHSNLMANQRMIQQAMEHSSDSTFVGWTPLFHDQGLIGNVLHPLYIGSLSVLMSPMTFVRRPLLWLEAISRYRAETSGGPDFAFALCVRRAKSEVLKRLDLSSWSVAYNGADRIHRRTLERFSETFKVCGFRREAFFNCYGLAEATLLVSGGPKLAEPIFQSKHPQQPEDRLLDCSASGAEDDFLVACGTSVTEQRLIIVDSKTSLPVSEGLVGEIWVSGPNVSRAYWNNALASKALNARVAGLGALAATVNAQGPEARAILQERFLRTGDLGFLSLDGQLVVTGRIKELIIVEGRNHYPVDIEQCIQELVSTFNLGVGAAVSYSEVDRQVIAVVQEVSLPAQDSEASRHVTNQIRRVVAETQGITVHRVVLVRKGSLPKTSSGKLQRGLVLRRLLASELDLWTPSDQRALLAREHSVADSAMES